MWTALGLIFLILCLPVDALKVSAGYYVYDSTEVEMNLSLSNFIPFDSPEIRTNIYIRQHSFHGAFTYILI